MKVPSMAMMPCRTGLLVCAAAWAMAADPSPDSFENMPRATPKRNWLRPTAAPANPPVAAAGVKA